MAKSKDFKISGLLKEKAIELDLKEKNKARLIAELVTAAARSGKIRDKKAFHRSLSERERLGSTAIGNGVAIPHARSKAVKEILLCFAKSKAGIDFGALDGEKVYLFFLLASPKDCVGEHLKILAKIAFFIKDKFIIELLKRADNKREIFKIIRAYDR
ncbi:PTS sugar transporter subunit IIA [Candidatus Omnitrophota bacterium]